jgi:hypothetical protein
MPNWTTEVHIIKKKYYFYHKLTIDYYNGDKVPTIKLWLTQPDPTSTKYDLFVIIITHFDTGHGPGKSVIMQ